MVEKQWPKSHDLINDKDNRHRDIAVDFFALRKIFQGGKWIYSEGPNNFNQASHCDMAWAGALSSKAGGLELLPCPPPKPFEKREGFGSRAARRLRQLVG